jgi:hypothetical protein
MNKDPLSWVHLLVALFSRKNMIVQDNGVKKELKALRSAIKEYRGVERRMYGMMFG